MIDPMLPTTVIDWMRSNPNMTWAIFAALVLLQRCAIFRGFGR